MRHCLANFLIVSLSEEEEKRRNTLCVELVRISNDSILNVLPSGPSFMER